MVAVTVKSVKFNGWGNTYDIDSINFRARSATRQEFDPATVDNNIEHESVQAGDTLTGYVSFEVPDGKKIATVELLDKALDKVAAWSY